jgi:hypothetical protein
MSRASEKAAKEKLSNTHYRAPSGKSLGKVPTSKKGGGNDDANYETNLTHGLLRRMTGQPPKRAK